MNPDDSTSAIHLPPPNASNLPAAPVSLADEETAPLSPRRSGFVIALLSMTLLALELTWTRLFSSEFVYTYAFLVLSLAIMGLGLGGLFLRFFPALGRRFGLSLVLCLCACTALAGPPLVFRLNLNFAKLFEEPAMAGRLLLVLLLLGSTYFLGGVALAALLRRMSRIMDRIYMADLFGAGAGVVLGIVLMNRAGTPSATFLIVLPLLAAALLAARGWTRLIPFLLLIAPFMLIGRAEGLLEARREERAPVIYKHWDATAKLKLYEYNPEVRGLNIDNLANSPVRAFDGNWDRPEDQKLEFGIDVSNLIKRFDKCTFLSLGAGGGGDVLQALQAGASEIHAVEVIPHINQMLVSGNLVDYTGRIYLDPRVRVVTEDARAYVRRNRHKFDMIYSLSSNTFAALTSGSFALAENYLFTTEAFRDYWESLTDDGFMMMEHQFFVPRLVPALLAALDELHVSDAREHFAVYDLPKMRRNMILLSKRPLTDEIRNNAFGELTEENYGDIHLLYPAPDSLKDNLINRIVQEGWPQVAGSAKVRIAPTTDDRPFIGQMGLWRNFDWRKPTAGGSDVFGYPLAQLIVLTVLLVLVVLVIPLNLLPCLTKGPRLRAAPWLYFFVIGAAFMSVEVVLIQKYTLFVGPSIYSIAAVLIALLIGCGLGSRCSTKIGPALAFTGLIVWLLLEALAMDRVSGALADLAFGWRIIVSVLLIAPLGFFMGIPFPKAGLRVGTAIDWGFAVNGAASVLGGSGVVLVAMTLGFRATLLIAAALYFLAFLLISWTARWTPRPCAANPAP